MTICTPSETNNYCSMSTPISHHPLFVVLLLSMSNPHSRSLTSVCAHEDHNSVIIIHAQQECNNDFGVQQLFTLLLQQIIIMVGAQLFCGD